VQQQRSKQDNGAPPDQSRLSPATTKLVKRLGLKYISTAELIMRRQRYGRGFGYLNPDGTPVTAAEKRRLAALAVPPAYEDVLAIIRNGSACARCAKRAGSPGLPTRYRASAAASASI
jgi:DNA topoisomerase IB